jgi:hypothetical protein
MILMKSSLSTSVAGAVRKQNHRNVYSNLMQDVRREHAGYKRGMPAAPTAETGSMLSYVRSSALNVDGCLDWIVKNNLPLHFCETLLPGGKLVAVLYIFCILFRLILCGSNFYSYSNLEPTCVSRHSFVR